MPVPAEVQRVFDEWEARDRAPQPAISWQRDRWIERYPGLTAKFEALPAELDRATVRANVLGQPLTNEGMFDAMVATYAWGWSATRVGVGRAARVLSAGPGAVGPALLGARARMLAFGPLAGYWALAKAHRVPGLGPAFGTKLLYFCSDANARALIIDRLVAAWLAERALLRIPASWYAKRKYESYLSAMSHWAAALGIEAHQLEELIFGDEARRRGLPGWGD